MAARVESIASARGAGLDRTRAIFIIFFFYCAFPVSELFYEGLKSVSKQLSDPPEALALRSEQKEEKKLCPAFSWEPQILLHTNVPLISWTVRNGKTLVLL